MKHRLLIGASLAVVFLVLARKDPQAGPREPARAAPGTVVFLEGAGDGAQTDVVARAPGTNSQPVLWGRVSHSEGSARRGVLLPSGEEALVVVAERPSRPSRPSRRASAYNSALFRVGGRVSTRLLGGLTDASSALVTARGTVLVQRGSDGPEPALDPERRELRERVDSLTLDRVDLVTGAVETVWRGDGQIAYLAAALSGDEVLVYLVTPAGAELFALDAQRRSARVLVGQMPPLARDFSYDAVHDDVVFARAAAQGSNDYEVVVLPAHGASLPRVAVRGASDHLMPRVLSGGSVAFSLPADRGLGLIARMATFVTRLAPDGDGADCVLGESANGRWIALRHSTAQREVITIFNRAENLRLSLEHPDRVMEFVGFAEPRGAP